MGEKIYVMAWTRCLRNASGDMVKTFPPGVEPENQDDDNLGYGYVTHYSGASFFAALIRFIRLHREGYGCVKWEWR